MRKHDERGQVMHSVSIVRYKENLEGNPLCYLNLIIGDDIFWYSPSILDDFKRPQKKVLKAGISQFSLAQNTGSDEWLAR